MERLRRVREARLASIVARTFRDGPRFQLAFSCQIVNPPRDYLARARGSALDAVGFTCPLGSCPSVTLRAINPSVFVVPDAAYSTSVYLSFTLCTTLGCYPGGRALKSDLRYSKRSSTTTSPGPSLRPKPAHRHRAAAQAVLDARAASPTSSLADLYDPLTMPPALVKAHQELDRAVDQPTVRPRPASSPTPRGSRSSSFFTRRTRRCCLPPRPSVAGSNQALVASAPGSLHRERRPVSRCRAQ